MNTLADFIQRRTTTRPAPHHGVEPPDWAISASCLSTDPEIFYPDKGGSTSDAKRVCAGCPARPQCLIEAMRAEHGIAHRYGVLGGLSAGQRVQLARSGWQPGDPTPPVKIGAPKKPCHLCHGAEYSNLATHQRASHPLGGAA